MKQLSALPGAVRKNSGNFTLIELLIVISIIALLAALLLPVLNQARGKARSIRCAGNLKQFGVAVQLYADSHNGLFIPAARSVATGIRIRSSPGRSAFTPIPPAPTGRMACSAPTGRPPGRTANSGLRRNSSATAMPFSTIWRSIPRRTATSDAALQAPRPGRTASGCYNCRA